MDMNRPKNSPVADRRALLKGIVASSVAAGSMLGLARPALSQRAKVNIAFWTFENPQQRPWMHKRCRQFMEQNPHVAIDFQSFPFGDLGKKLSVGFATGTAPEGFVSQDWFMPTWLSKNLLEPLDLGRLGYGSFDAFSQDFAKAFVDGATQDGKVYGYPLWFYGFCNYLNTAHFKEAGLDAERDWPKTYQELGEVSRRLTQKDGSRFRRQGFKFAMHAAQWSMIHFNPILLQHGGQWFDAAGKCTLNNDAGLAAIRTRISLAKHFGSEDPADTIATNPIPALDWLKERASMFWSHPLPPTLIQAQNPKMASEGYYRPVQYPGVEAGRGYSTTYGFNLVINAQARPEKKDVLHDLYRFIMSEPLDCWKDTAPFTLARRSGWADSPEVQRFPHVAEILKARDNGVFLPRSIVFNELADAVHRGVQKILLNNADEKATLDEIAAEVDRASANAGKG